MIQVFCTFRILVQQNIFTTIALAVHEWIGTPVQARLLHPKIGELFQGFGNLVSLNC